MRHLFRALALLLVIAGCGRQDPPEQKFTPADAVAPASQAGKPLANTSPQPKKSLAEARREFKASLVRKHADHEAPPEPPAELFRLVRYDSPVGKLAAYLTRTPNDGKKRPAIIWITGGDCNSIGDDIWKDAPEDNDQSARAFREAGIVMMFPSLRGGNSNPGFKEAFLGEVEDVQAAARFLEKQESVDPERIYLGGHSTGGTMVLLVAETTDRFRATFSFGPAKNGADYAGVVCGFDHVPFEQANMQEVRLRSPVEWLHSIRSPVFAFEGADDGNVRDLAVMAANAKNPLAHFYLVPGATHFSILAPTTRLIAEKILEDTGPKMNISFTEQELNRPFAKK